MQSLATPSPLAVCARDRSFSSHWFLHRRRRLPRPHPPSAPALTPPALALSSHVDAFGPLDLAFLNAGIEERRSFLEGGEEWRKVMDVDLNAVIDGTRLAVQQFRSARRQARPDCTAPPFRPSTAPPRTLYRLPLIRRHTRNGGAPVWCPTSEASSRRPLSGGHPHQRLRRRDPPAAAARGLFRGEGPIRPQIRPPLPHRAGLNSLCYYWLLLADKLVFALARLQAGAAHLARSLEYLDAESGVRAFHDLSSATECSERSSDVFSWRLLCLRLFERSRAPPRRRSASARCARATRIPPWSAE